MPEKPATSVIRVDEQTKSEENKDLGRKNQGSERTNGSTGNSIKNTGPVTL
jgi:hypothetical protein